MVFFTCNACGESLKKNQVEKHYLHKCRRCEVLTCVDCHKDFPGDAYKDHTKCISEEEKYSAKGWQPKSNANKGAKKQADWLERLTALIEENGKELDADVRQVLQNIQGFDNIPRKRVKFLNFCKNAMPGRKFPPAVIEKTWDVFEIALKGPKKDVEVDSKTINETKCSITEDSPSEKENGVKSQTLTTDKDVRDGIPKFKGTAALETKPTKKQKKRKALEEHSNASGDEIKKDAAETPSKNKKLKMEIEEDGDNSVLSAKFDWIKCMSEVIEKKGSIKITKLKKKVVNEFCTLNPDTIKSRLDLEKKFEKKLGKCKKFKISNNTVEFSTSRTD